MTRSAAFVAPALRALKIAKPDTGGYYYLSFRQATGYDQSLDPVYTQGVNVHRYAGSGYALTSFVDSLATGESFQDAANGFTVTQLARASDGSYSFSVSASGPGSSGSGSAVAIVDGTAPSPPTLSAAIQKKTQVKLTWSGASDGSGSGIASYRIHREGGSGPRDFTSTTTTYTDATTTSGTAYTYTVRAVDRAGNPGATSNAVAITPGGSAGGGGGGGKPRR